MRKDAIQLSSIMYISHHFFFTANLFYSPRFTSLLCFCSQVHVTSILHKCSVIFTTLFYSYQFCFSSLIFCYFTSVLFCKFHFNFILLIASFTSLLMYSLVCTFQQTSIFLFFSSLIFYCFAAVLFCKFHFSVIQCYEFYLTSTLLYSQRKVNTTSILLCYVALYHCSIIFCKFITILFHITSLLF